MESWSTGSVFKIAFNNFNNPSVQKLFFVPIDITFRYINRGTLISYTSYWPSVYLSDSVNMGSPTEISGSLVRSNNNRGFSNTHFIPISWPYTSVSGAS